MSSQLAKSATEELFDALCTDALAAGALSEARYDRMTDKLAQCSTQAARELEMLRLFIIFA